MAVIANADARWHAGIAKVASFDDVRKAKQRLAEHRFEPSARQREAITADIRPVGERVATAPLRPQ